jgi:hypothetical protein
MKLVSIFVFFLAFCCAYPICAQLADNEAFSDAQSFCNYIQDKNKARSILLKSPDAIARLDNGLVYNNFQKIAVAGLSKDLSDFSKARQIDKLIEEECTYYTLNQAAQLQIQFAMQRVKVDALQFKLQHIRIAANKLKQILKTIKKRLDSHNDTLRTYYGINETLIKLEDAEREIAVDLASQQFPKIPHANLKKLLANLSTAQAKRQKTLNKLERQKNWSIRMEAGAQRDLSSDYNKNVQPYFALLVRYNLGSMMSNNKMKHSFSDYMVWQKRQVNGSQRNLEHLILSIVALKEAETVRLSHLKQSYEHHRGLSMQLSAVHSIKATHFKREVEVDKIMLDIELHYLQRSIELLNTLI